MAIRFNRAPIVGREIEYLRQVLAGGHLSGDGPFTTRCHQWLESEIGCVAARLTHSCTAALEMAAILADLCPGDEVIMPSFTFVSTANAVVLRGGVPVFVDIRSDTLNIDEKLIEQAITKKTKAIMVVHYAGVCAEMDVILDIAARHKLMVIEDAAQALGSTYRGKHAGAIAEVGCFSFHESKNIVSGEGGAIIINDGRLTARADIIREKGTNRRAFYEGMVDKYTWVDIGSSYLPSELNAAYLLAQFEASTGIIQERIDIWNRYHSAFEFIEEAGIARRPIVPAHCEHNGHLYYLLLPTQAERNRLIAQLKQAGITAPFHYVPLHSSPAGQRLSRIHGDLAVTNDLSSRLIRLPLFIALGDDQHRVIDRVLHHLDAKAA